MGALEGPLAEPRAAINGGESSASILRQPAGGNRAPQPRDAEDADELEESWGGELMADTQEPIAGRVESRKKRDSSSSGGASTSKSKGGRPRNSEVLMEASKAQIKSMNENATANTQVMAEAVKAFATSLGYP